MASQKTVDLFANPMVKRVSKIEETNENCATYKGITAKCGFFMLMIAAGVAIELAIHFIFPADPQALLEGIVVNIPSSTAQSRRSFSRSYFQSRVQFR